MFRLQQILQNTFIRLLGWFQQLFSNTTQFLIGFLGGIARILGFTGTGRFLDEQAPSTEPEQLPKPSSATEEPSASKPWRRRPDPNMDYYRNLARQINK